MEDTRITFTTARLAKDKKFNWTTRDYFGQINAEPFELHEGSPTDYNSTYWEEEDGEWISTPTQSLLQKWLREVHSIVITIDHWTKQPVDNEIWDNCYDYNFQQLHHGTTPHKSYEEALEAGLFEALKLIETK